MNKLGRATALAAMMVGCGIDKSDLGNELRHDNCGEAPRIVSITVYEHGRMLTAYGLTCKFLESNGELRVTEAIVGTKAPVHYKGLSGSDRRALSHCPNR